MDKLTVSDLPAHRDRLVGLARHLGLSPTAAEDVTQTCLLAALQRLRAGAVIPKPRAYLNTALRHACARHRTRQGQATLSIDADTNAQALSTASPETALYLQEVIEALDGLPPEQAHLLKRVAEGETSPAALAAETGLPVGTIMSRLARGRRALRLACEGPRAGDAKSHDDDRSPAAAKSLRHDKLF